MTRWLSHPVSGRVILLRCSNPLPLDILRALGYAISPSEVLLSVVLYASAIHATGVCSGVVSLTRCLCRYAFSSRCLYAGSAHSSASPCTHFSSSRHPFGELSRLLSPFSCQTFVQRVMFPSVPRPAIQARSDLPSQFS